MSFNNLFCQAVILCLLSVSFYNLPGKTSLHVIDKKPFQVIDSLFALSSSNISINNEIAILYAEKGKDFWRNDIRRENKNTF